MGRKEDAARKAKAKAKSESKADKAKSADLERKAKVEAVKGSANAKRAAVLESAVMTGVLGSQEQSLDIKIEQFSLGIYGKEFLSDTKLELNFGRRYGLIGMNESGKSTMLAGIAAREVPIPEHIDIWFLDSEAKPDEVTAVQAVVDVVAKEHTRPENLGQTLLEEDPEKNADLLAQISEKLDKMDPPPSRPARASSCTAWASPRR